MTPSEPQRSGDPSRLASAEPGSGESPQRAATRPTWAKAPDFADQPVRQAAVRAQTVVDKQHYLDTGLTPLRCQTCSAQVLVRKASAHQTSVQWTERPDAHCPVFAQLAEHGARPGRPESCPSLEKSIKWAIDEGVLEVGE
ncbi:hypothetical protein [Nocardia sp. NPDC058480]|uniref:hypothetical protein n=1 Tax=Nocardia sp. NPDC058480 TaxID=3346522 RepID=UPI00364AA4AC